MMLTAIAIHNKSYHTVLYHIISYHTTSYRIISYHNISYHIIGTCSWLLEDWRPDCWFLPGADDSSWGPVYAKTHCGTGLWLCSYHPHFQAHCGSGSHS